MAAPHSLGGGVVRFGAFELDLRSGELRKQGVKVKLQEQPFQVLTVLLEHPGEIVTREDLRQRVWPADTFVDFDHGVYNAIKKLREALGDSAENPRFIETLARRGYRFLVPVQVNGETTTAPNVFNGNTGSVLQWPAKSAAAAIAAADVSRDSESAAYATQETSPGPRWRIGVIAALAGFLVLLGVVVSRSDAWRNRLAGSSSPQIRSLAVLPLQNLSADPAQEYFADGMTEELITELSRISALKVISRTSVMRYKKTDKSLPEIARELKVDGIVEGSVLRSGDRVRITAQLIHAAKDANVWAQTYDRDVRDVLVLQAAVAGAIANEVKAKMTPGETARLKTTRAVNPGALDAYLEGKYHLNRSTRGVNTDEEVQKAFECFRRAIAEDPEFARAYIAIADAYTWLLARPTNMWQLQKDAAEKALAIDASSADAHVILGCVKFTHDWDWPGAEKEFRRAIELDPNSASAHDALGTYFDTMGRLDEGMSELQTAEELDPAGDHLRDAFRRRRQFDRAIERLQRFVENDPDNGFWHINLYEFYADAGMQEPSIKELQRAAVLYGYKDLAEHVGRAYTRSGYEAAMRVWGKEFEEGHRRGQMLRPFMVAEAYGRIGDKAKTWEWLQKAYDLRDDMMVCGLTTSKPLDFIRSDPRYTELVRRIGLPQ